MRSSKSSTRRRRGRDRAENIGHDVRLVGLGVGTLVELLDVGQVERTLRAGPLAVAAHVEVQVPEDAQLRRDNGIGAEDAPAGEVGAQPLEDDDVRREEQEGRGVIVPSFGDGVEVLPGDGERHDLGLAAAGGHLDGIASEIVVLEDVDAGHIGVPLDEIAMTANPLDLEEPDQRLDGFALCVVVRERAAHWASGDRWRTSS